MAKISDYSIQDILAAIGVETMRSGNNVVCRCPICKTGEPLKKDNFEAQINDNSETPTLYCHACGKAYTRTELIKELNLYNVLDIPEYDETRRFEKKENIKPATVTPAETDINEIDRLLTAEIPPILWGKDANSFKNIKLTQYAGQNRLLITAPNSSTITRNAGSIKWKWNGQQPVFSRFTNKQLIFLASGVAEWLILDWLGFDYIVLPSDAKKTALIDFKAQLQNKAVIILPDHDKSGSFDKVIEAVKAIVEGVHVVDFYDDKDFRDYCRRTAPSFDNKPQFIDSLLYNIFIEIGGNDSAEIVSEIDIYNLILKSKPSKPAEYINEFDEYLITNLIKYKKPIISIRVMGLKIQYRGITGLIGATSAGKTDIALQLAEEHANIDGHISLYLYYEGLPDELAERAEKKKITGNNIYAINNLTDFKVIEKFINTFKNKKILIITDYYQTFAWNLLILSSNKNASIRDFTTQIFIEQNKLRIKYDNVCFFNIFSMNNDTIKETGRQQSVHPAAVLNGAKEDGNIQYQVDYAYAILFSDEINGDYKLSRYDQFGKIKPYIKLATAKPNKVGIESGNPVYEWEDGRFKLIDVDSEIEKERQYFEKKNAKLLQKDIPWEIA